ncbi:MAG: hypothetical protein JWN66_3548 [Sphingomonas bacterium]|uniref:hypothetical protein n=1 Tax=Sphingomonas bacterium TaxID=1895847 RepID=UPI00262E74E2|nr:hypothetical protein [Sphingomonas bacterium]MDB5706432.1 hypothetical protein [Sphingomonas bacterium]
MQRRSFLSSALIALLASILPAGPAIGQARVNRTRWKVRSSQGFDAIAFLGPLSGTQLYLDYYAQDAAAFAPRLPAAVRSDIADLWADAGKTGFGLLGPSLSVLFSANGNDATIDSLLTALGARTTMILPTYKASPYWADSDWAWFDAAALRLEAIFSAMRAADFAGFRQERTGAGLDARIAEVARALAGFDVITLQERLSGRTFDPTIEIVLLHFCKPHGIKVQGQMFLQAADYDTATTVRIAAHEMLHPPVPMDGAAAKAALAIFARDPLIATIVRDHDPRWGYTTLEGMLNEDLVQALDQLISEVLGVGRNPADRWHQSDDGMHVLAAGFYGLLRQDRWIGKGGSIEAWLADAAARGRLAPAAFHPVAARVLERPVDALWPLPADKR